MVSDAADLFEAHLWESSSSRAARGVLAGEGLDEEVIRAFGVGYAPIGQTDLIQRLLDMGYSTDEIVEAGLAGRSVRGRLHARFRSRIMFPVRDVDGRVLGFAGLGTHLGPSWTLWLTSPVTGPYRPSEAVFGLDRAADAIADSGVASVRADCIEVLRAHQEGSANAVAVHSKRVTREQMLALSEAVPGGIDALELDLPPGMRADPKDEAPADSVAASAPRPTGRDADPTEAPPPQRLKRIAVVAATALAATFMWTGAPLLAVWVGSQVQQDRLLSLTGVLAVLVVLSLLALMLGWALAWLNSKYNELLGRPRTAGQTSLWSRSMRDEHPRDVFARYGITAPEKAAAACVAVGVIAFEVWFLFFAGSSLPAA